MPKGVYEKRLKPAEERFARYVEPEPMSGCWLWIGWSDRKGYGYLGLGRKGDGRMPAHRFSYQLHRGLIPAGMHVLHKCDVPSCVNPAHLFLGTHQENMADMWAKGRGPAGERQGCAKLTALEAATIRTRAAGGTFQCALASEYQVARATINRLVKGKTWSRVIG